VHGAWVSNVPASDVTGNEVSAATTCSMTGTSAFSASTQEAPLPRSAIVPTHAPRKTTWTLARVFGTTRTRSSRSIVKSGAGSVTGVASVPSGRSSLGFPVAGAAAASSKGAPDAGRAA
jgi:hypothetical protein